MRAREHATDVERSAIHLLHRTAAPAQPNGDANQIRQEIQQVQGRIDGRQWALEAEQHIPQARLRLAQAKAAGPGQTQSSWMLQQGELKAAKANLTELIRLSKTKWQAENDIAADQAEIGRLRIALQGAEERHRALSLVPENVAWAD